MKTPFLALAILFLIPISYYSQTGNLALRGGISTVRGETSDGAFNGQYGYDISLSYILSLSSEEWMLTSELAHCSYAATLELSGKPADSSFDAQITQNYIGIGFRRYLSRSVATMNPYPGQLLPYLGLNFGCVQNNVDVHQVGALPSAYRILPETTYQMAFQFEGGLDITLSEKWCIHSYFLLRTGRTDNWDALTGRGYGSDWLVRGGLGIIYRL